jgi:single-strand DNA-binding protein
MNNVSTLFFNTSSQTKKLNNMKAIRNSIQLIGNLGRDVEVVTFDSGTKKATFTIATSESYINKKGEKTEDTQWHNIVAWGKLADLMSTLLEKGNQVLVKGKLVNRSYEDKEGNKKYVSEIVANEFMKFSRKEMPF